MKCCRPQSPVIATTMLLLLMMVGLMSTAVEGKHSPRVEAFFQGRCTPFGPCHQLCVDLTGGGFECACKEGYTLQPNGFSCFPTLIFSSDESSPETDDSTSLNHGDTDDKFQLNEPSKSPNSRTNSTESIEKVLHGENNITRASHLDDNLFVYMFSDGEAGHSDQPPENSREGNIPNDFDEVSLPREWTAGHGEGIHPDDFQDVSFSKQLTAGHRGRHRIRTSREYPGHDESLGKVSRRQKHNLMEDSFFVEPSGRSLSGASLERSNSSARSEAAGLGRRPGVETIGHPEQSRVAGKSGPTCEEFHCNVGGRCVPDSRSGGGRCQCPLGTHGLYCERDLVAKYPKFSGSSYIAFPVLRGAHREFTITIEFKPDSSNGLLLFCADHPHARFDFFSIAIQNGLVEFRFDCGSGMALIRSTNEVELSRWNTVTVHRTEWNAALRLNNGTQSNGRSKGKFSHINFREDLYLGGYTALVKISDRVGSTMGFAGCVRRLQVNDKSYDMRKGAFIGDAIQGVDIEDCSSDVCSRLHCLNGGTCAASGADAGLCLCPMGTAGQRCEAKVDVNVPMFNGSSFLQFIGLQRNVLSFTEIEIVLRPVDRDGLIFYNGYAKDRTGDFISLGLRNGYVEYRFDLGTGAAYIRSPQPLELNEWHTVRFSRTGRNGFLKVDNQRLVEGMASGAFTQLTLTLDLFIGGHRNFDEVAKAAQVTKSFRGCIQKVIVNKRPMKLLEELMTGINIDNCDHPCRNAPCFNGGRCIPLKDAYRCSCPLHFHSLNCQERALEPITVPAFSGDSYLLYIDPHMTQRTRGKKIDVQMRVRPRDPDGLLFWVSEEEASPYSDYLAIGLRGGFAHLSYNLGSGEVVITNNQTRIDDNQWHSVRVQRSEKVGYLQIDGTQAVEGTSPGSMKQLTTFGTIFIGGMDDIVHGTLRKYSTGFVGCIANVTLATDFQVDLIAEADEGSNIAQCHDDGKPMRRNEPLLW